MTERKQIPGYEGLYEADNSGKIYSMGRVENISGFASPLFMPWYFIFKTEVPLTLAELIEENPNRSYKFTDEYGQEWKGFLRMAGIAPNEYTPQEFRLLAAPGQDLTKLIHG